MSPDTRNYDRQGRTQHDLRTESRESPKEPRKQERLRKPHQEVAVCWKLPEREKEAYTKGPCGANRVCAVSQGLGYPGEVCVGRVDSEVDRSLRLTRGGPERHT